MKIHKELPPVDVEVMVVLNTGGTTEIHEGYLRPDGRWYVYLYGMWLSDVVGWLPKPTLDETI